MGIAFSRDRGETWTPSKIPGYPSDTSAEGMARPLHGRQAEAGDPLLASTATATCSPAASPSTGSTRRTATCGWPRTRADPHASGYPKDYLRTVVVGQGTPALHGIFEDKPELEVDRTGGRFDGNVYICWSRFVGFNGRTQISFSRSTDSGQTFSHPILLSFGKDVQGCDIAIEHDGDVRDLGDAEHPVRDRRAGPRHRPICRWRRDVPAGPSDRDLHPVLPVRRRA